MSAASAPPPIDTVRHLMVDGHDRRYLLHALPGLQTGRPAPLLLAFHPGYATGAGFARTTGLNNRADALGYAVAYPNGIYRSWNAGDCCGPPSRDGVDDVAFAMSVIDDVASVVSIDRREVFAAGFSNGAGLVYLLACREASSISAIAVAGSPLHIALDECRPSRPMPVLAFHGLADPVAPFNGGRGIMENVGEQLSVPSTIHRWLAINGCAAQGGVTVDRGQAHCVTWVGRSTAAEVTLCTIEGMGHQWPGGSPYNEKIFGPQSCDISASDMAMAFFERHRVSSTGADPTLPSDGSRRTSPPLGDG